VQHLNKDRSARLVGADDLAVEDGVTHAEPLGQLSGERVEVLEVVPFARDRARAGAVDFHKRAELATSCAQSNQPSSREHSLWNAEILRNPSSLA
jgi:hypothetical protein